MRILRLLRWLGALLAAFGVALIVLEPIILIYVLVLITPGPYHSLEDLLYSVIRNVQSAFYTLGVGIAMVALGLFLWHWTGREMARPQQQP